MPPAAHAAADDGAALAGELHAMLTALVQRAPLFADLRSKGIAEDLVQDTLIAVTQRVARGGPVDDPFAYAARCVTNLAKRTYLRGGRELAMADEHLERLGPAVADVADYVHLRMSTAEVLDIVRSVNTVLADLAPVDLELVKAELTRTDQKQLASRLGISRPTLYRRKGPAIAAFVAAVARRAGTRPCPAYSGALLAAAGDSGFEAARSAREHAAHCEECRETLRHLTAARHGLAIIAPVPLAAEQADPAGVLERLMAATQAAGDWARSVVVRTGDPTPLGGSGAKTAAILAAACTGGGGVYCAVEGLPQAVTAPFTGHVSPSRPAVGAGSVRPVAAAVRQVLAAAQVTGGAPLTQPRPVAAGRRSTSAAPRATRMQRRVRARLLAERQRRRELRAATPPPHPTASAPEFTAPVPSPVTIITRREFARPTVGGREFAVP